MPKKTKTTPELEQEVTSKPLPKGKYFYATGKRKRSIAKVRLYKGEGNITINDKPMNDYITLKTLIGVLKAPFKLTDTLQKFDTIVLVRGGGIRSQVEAIRHGISKALVLADPFNKPTIKKAGLLTRDSRIKERKKYGLKRARRGPQFSKR